MEVNRRGFLAAAALAAPAAFAEAGNGAQPCGRPLKVCVFADLHYHPGFWTNDTPEFLEKIMARAERERCDMMIQSADLTLTQRDAAI